MTARQLRGVRLAGVALLAVAVAVLAADAAMAGEACGSSGSVDCCTMGGILEDDLDADGNDIKNLDDMYQDAQSTDVAVTPIQAIGTKPPYVGVGATNNAGASLCLIPASGNNQLTGVTKAGTTGDTITITSLDLDCTVTTTTLQEGAGVGEYDCDGAASDVACVTNLAVVAAAAATAGKFGYLAAAGTETGLFYAPAGVALWVGVVPSDGTNTAITQGNDGQVLVPAGSVAAPAISFTNDTDTGLYWYGTNTLAIGSGGTYRLYIGASALTSSLTLKQTAAANYIYNDAAVLSLGAACTSTHALGTGATCSAGSLEVDGTLYADEGIELRQNRSITGTTGAASNGALYLAAQAQTPDTAAYFTGSLSNAFLIAEYADVATDFGLAQQANPTLAIQSGDATSPTKRLLLSHDQTNASFGVGSGDFAFKDDGGKGVSSNIRTITESVTFANDATKVTAGSIMPDGAFIFGVSGRVTTLLAGCTSVSVGDGVDADLFKNNLALAAGSTFTNADATAAFSTISGGHAPRVAAGEITVTANGGNCTAGVVALTVHYLDVTAATAN